MGALETQCFSHIRELWTQKHCWVLCALSMLCWCTALGSTTVCSLPLGVSISLWPIDSVCIYSKLSPLGRPDHHYCMDSWIPGLATLQVGEHSSFSLMGSYSAKSLSVNVLTVLIRAAGEFEPLLSQHHGVDAAPCPHMIPSPLRMGQDYPGSGNNALAASLFSDH